MLAVRDFRLVLCVDVPDPCSPRTWFFSPKHEDSVGDEGGEYHGDNDGRLGGDDGDDDRPERQ